MGKARHHSFVYFRLFLYTGCIYAGAADYTLIAGRRLTNEPSLEISSRASSSQDVADTGIALRQRSNASTHIKPPTIIPEHERGPRLPRASDRRHKWSVRSHPSGQGIDNGKQAEQQPGSRVLRPFQIRLHYTACYGLINQYYSHIAAFILASTMAAEIVIPPSLMRDTFGRSFSAFKDVQQATWESASTDMLLDVKGIKKAWQAHGLIVHETPALGGQTNFTAPDDAWPIYHQSEEEMALTVYLKDVYLKMWDLSVLQQRAEGAVMAHAMKLIEQSPGLVLHHINLFLPCTFFMLQTRSCLSQASLVARNLPFAPDLNTLAEEIIDGMKRVGVVVYNGIHLRIEKDAKEWAEIMGGEKAVWEAYVTAVRKAGFNSLTPLYVASGLQSYGARQEMRQAEAVLFGMNVCSHVHTKEMYLQQTVIDGLASEQKALLDFLVLTKADRYVGFGSSTFSFYLQQYRLLQGFPETSSVLVNASVITTDSMFEAAGVVSH